MAVFYDRTQNVRIDIAAEEVTVCCSVDCVGAAGGGDSVVCVVAWIASARLEEVTVWCVL